MSLLLEHAELRLVRMPLLHPFETSFGVETHKEFVLVSLSSGDHEGIGEGVMDTEPLYREETNTGAYALLRDTLLPTVLGKRFATAEALMLSLSHFRGNRMAKATLEQAFWDLLARSLGVPLWQLLGGTRTEVPVGVSLGIRTQKETLEQVAQHVDQGYKRIKLKIKPGWDIAPVAAVREKFPSINLTVDANSAYTLKDTPLLAHLDGYDLDYVEQPLQFDDLHDHAQLAQRMQTPICLDESICSARDARVALEIGAGSVINIKVGRVGGFLEARRVHDVALAFGAPVWCGGMLEAGIGRAHNIHLATLSNFSKPGDTSSASRYFARDIVNEKLETKDGMMPIPAGPGSGVSLDLEYLERVTLKQETVRP